MSTQEKQFIRDLHRHAIAMIGNKTGALHRRRNYFEKNKDTKLPADLEKYFEKGIQGHIGNIKEFHKELDNYPYIDQEFKNELEEKINYFEELFNQFDREFKAFYESKNAHCTNSEKISLFCVNKLSSLHRVLGNSMVSGSSTSGVLDLSLPSKKCFLEKVNYEAQQGQNSSVSDRPQINSLPPKKRFRYIPGSADSASSSLQVKRSSERKSQDDQNRRKAKRIG